ARWFVSVVAPNQMATAKSVTELLDCLFVKHDLATRHRRDFYVRHVRVPSSSEDRIKTRTARRYRRPIFTRSVMNSRLFIRSPRRRGRAACLEFGGQAPWRS